MAWKKRFDGRETHFQRTQLTQNADFWRRIFVHTMSNTYVKTRV